GRTGLRVSLIGLGTLTWGRDTDEHDAATQLRDFLDAGGNLVDTAGTYGEVRSETVIGVPLDGEVHRADVVINTMSGVRRGSVDASSGNLLSSLDASLSRLGTDYVDLWFVHAPDAHTPITETVTAMKHAIASGRASYVGLSNFSAWQSAQVATMLEGDPGLAAAQVEYSLLARDIAIEMINATEAPVMEVLAWSALGRGVLTGKYRHSVP